MPTSQMSQALFCTCIICASFSIQLYNISNSDLSKIITFKVNANIQIQTVHIAPIQIVATKGNKVVTFNTCTLLAMTLHYLGLHLCMCWLSELQWLYRLLQYEQWYVFLALCVSKCLFNNLFSVAEKSQSSQLNLLFSCRLEWWIKSCFHL